MAKSKPQKSAESSASNKKALAKKTSKPAPSSSDSPMVDTTLAAQAVASMMSNRAAMGGAPASSNPTAPKATESSTFKQMKEGLNKPSSQVMGNVLGNVQGKRKANLPFGGGKQVGHNQTFGADVNRTGVPRRTGGG